MPSAFPGAFKSPSVQGTQSEVKVSPVKSTAGEEENESYLEEEHDPCPDFKPIVPLPEKVEVRTGEEDEEVGCRAYVLVDYFYTFWKMRIQ